METVTTPPETDQPSSRRPTRRVLMVAAAVVVGVVLLLAILLVVVRAARPGVLPGLELAGQDVGGMSRTQLTATVDQIAGEREGAAVTATLRDNRRAATTAELGLTVDREATVDAAWRRGRQVNPLTAATDHLRATFGTIRVGVAESLDDEQLARWATRTADELAIEPVEGSVSMDGTDIVSRDPRQGAQPDVEHLEEQGRAAVDTPGSDTFEVDSERIATETTEADVARVTAAAERVVSAPVELRHDDEALTVSPDKLATLYTVEEPEGDSPLRLTLLRDTAADIFDDDAVARFNTDPEDASIVLTGAGPTVEEGTEGFAIDVEQAVDTIDELARSEPGGEARAAAMPGEVVEPDLTTEEAEQLEITERVSSFTTEHACCQGRVTNIHRFADIVDGAVIQPGETFSLNGHVGERTRAKGFVGGGAIQQGEYVDEVGGGVSQFATTFFNAAFFGGYQIDEHKPHSYYISRYPVGRESTINWPNVDVKITNDSPYGLLVDTSYSDTSITVTFWGREWADVASSTGEPFNYTSPEVQYEENADLPAGTEQVVQEGGEGFDIVVTRRIDYLAGGAESEEYFTRYLAEPRIIERGPAE